MASSPGATRHLAGHRRVAALGALLVGAVHLGVADDELVGDRVVVAHDELDERALAHPRASPMAKRLWSMPTSTVHHARARGRRARPGRVDGVARAGGEDAGARPPAAQRRASAPHAGGRSGAPAAARSRPTATASTTTAAAAAERRAARAPARRRSGPARSSGSATPVSTGVGSVVGVGRDGEVVVEVAGRRRPPGGR